MTYPLKLLCVLPVGWSSCIASFERWTGASEFFLLEGASLLSPVPPHSGGFVFVLQGYMKNHWTVFLLCWLVQFCVYGESPGPYPGWASVFAQGGDGALAVSGGGFSAVVGSGGGSWVVLPAGWVLGSNSVAAVGVVVGDGERWAVLGGADGPVWVREGGAGHLAAWAEGFGFGLLIFGWGWVYRLTKRIPGGWCGV